MYQYIVFLFHTGWTKIRKKCEDIQPNALGLYFQCQHDGKAEHTFYRARLEASTQTITPPMRLNWNIMI
jgi:hypothetical protein